MRACGLFVVMLVLSYGAPAAVFARNHVGGSDSPLYVAAGGGIAYVPELPADRKLKNNTAVGRDDSWAFEWGWGVHGAVGFDVGGHTRAEAEFSYLTAGIGSLQGTANTDFREPPRAASMSFTVIALYELDTGGSLRPFIGFGMGAAHTTASTGTPKVETRLRITEGDYVGWGAAFHAKAGIGYELFEEFAIRLAYRLVAIAPTTLALERKIGKDDPRYAEYDTEIVTLPFPGLTAHRVELGLSYRLPL